MATTETKTNQKPVLLKNVRLSFPHLFEASASVEGGPKKYRASLLIDPTTADGKANLKAIEAAIAAVERETFKKTPMVYKNPDRKFLADGDSKIKASTNEPYTGYEGMMVVVASNKSRPVIVDQMRNPLAAEDGKPYAGCYVNAAIRPYAIKDAAKGGNGLFASLEAVQFLRDGEPFGAAPVKAEDVFDEVADEEDL